MHSQNEIRQGITDKIIESLKSGRIPWRKPWSGIDGPRTPTNFVTKRRYTGVNIPILWAASQERGYDVDYYATFNQWKSIGASIKKGERAIHVVLFKPVKKVVKQEVEFPTKNGRAVKDVRNIRTPPGRRTPATSVDVVGCRTLR